MDCSCLFRSIRFGVLLPVAMSIGSDAAAQAYTYEEPACGVPYRSEPAKPEDFRTVYEMSAANKCVQLGNVPAACRHWQAAMAGLTQPGRDTSNDDGIRVYLRTMLRTNGCS